jgi:hypothetical protein
MTRKSVRNDARTGLYGNEGSYCRTRREIPEALAWARRSRHRRFARPRLGATIAKELADAGATTIINYHHNADLADHVLEEFVVCA